MRTELFFRVFLPLIGLFTASYLVIVESDYLPLFFLLVGLNLGNLFNGIVDEFKRIK